MKSMLIRAEDKNVWERRVPLTPMDLREIIMKTGVDAYVENSEKRCFKSQKYEDAGAAVCAGMCPGEVIFGVKEIPPEKILEKKVYVFFSHTIKGQRTGLPLLKKIKDSGSTLIDYERICDAQNRRLIYFGHYAGDAGAIDIISLMGEYWAFHNLQTPFTECRRAHQYQDLKEAKHHLRRIGKKIEINGFPEALCPVVIGILGYGNVSSGAQEIFNCLPVEKIAPAALRDTVEKGGDMTRKIIMTVFQEKDMARRHQNGPFDLQEYYLHPEKYTSRFGEYLPYINILVNAIYWEEKYPRFVTRDSLKALYANGTRPKLNGIADISCDTNGAIECNCRSTDSGMPAYRFDPINHTIQDVHRGEGIVILAVDNLPCELPFDASTFFSGQLKKFVPEIILADYDKALEASGLGREVQKGVVVYNGCLTPGYAYLTEYVS